MACQDMLTERTVKGGRPRLNINLGSGMVRGDSPLSRAVTMGAAASLPVPSTQAPTNLSDFCSALSSPTATHLASASTMPPPSGEATGPSSRDALYGAHHGPKAWALPGLPSTASSPGSAVSSARTSACGTAAGTLTATPARALAPAPPTSAAAVASKGSDMAAAASRTSAAPQPAAPALPAAPPLWQQVAELEAREAQAEALAAAVASAVTSAAGPSSAAAGTGSSRAPASGPALVNAAADAQPRVRNSTRRGLFEGTVHGGRARNLWQPCGVGAWAASDAGRALVGVMSEAPVPA
ncbi:hypothetical protein HYH03_015019 [Edaphochlamys debaryana]|uniref:Uncharacterized protein n=1 Tax=Edaphochlamys debaryana TaxID=47281 RepID=A0A835XMS2_9CHLO|nr:hypothetical protein HYH03_015019 [Edaphochlamys debaryana]|eukprot:KAG2486315.1 hypothetical protein HYH03_015019 [Edaphochlamys debaryana]